MLREEKKLFTNEATTSFMVSYALFFGQNLSHLRSCQRMTAPYDSGCTSVYILLLVVYQRCSNGEGKREN